MKIDALVFETERTRKMIPYELKIEHMLNPQLASSPMYRQKLVAATQLIHLKIGEVKMLAMTNQKRMQLAEEMQVKSGKAQQQDGQAK